MGKAFMGLNMNAAIATTNESNLFGATLNTTESVMQYEATEAATFTRLRTAISAGGSGTNTCQFRVNGANGNLAAVGAGTGVQEDTANKDVLAATDLFNLAFTDTGTDPTYSNARAVVEFASGHGCFYAASDPVVFDVASTTVFLPLGGNLVADGTTTEANVAFRVRGHDTFEALQVRVTANARTNDSTVKNRIAAADGTASITIGAGLTGIFKATGLGDAIADGNAVCASLTLGTGVEDLTISICGATLKSSTGFKSESWCGSAGGTSRTASATAHHFMICGTLVTLSSAAAESVRQVPLGFVATVSKLRAYVTANTYTGNCTLAVRRNGADVITLTITAGATGWQENTTDTAAFLPEDLINFQIDEGTANSITITMVGITIDSTPRIVPIVDYLQRRMAA